jgi:hypothetical protein
MMMVQEGGSITKSLRFAAAGKAPVNRRTGTVCRGADVQMNDVIEEAAPRMAMLLSLTA